MNPYERWDDWEWEKAVQELGRGRNARPPARAKTARGRRGWQGAFDHWTGGQKKTLLAALFFLTVFFGSGGRDPLSVGVAGAYRAAMAGGNYFFSLNGMAKEVMGLGGITNPALPVDASMEGRFYPPVSGKVVAGFGQRDSSGAVLEGIDVASSLGTPVVSPYDGVVSAVTMDPRLGKVVKLDLGNGWSTVLGNLGDVAVTRGERVKQGQTVGTVGLSAPLKEPWLHFELRKDNRPLNPLPYLIPPPGKP
ncbi:Peptidase family M23 [Acididesulfobacillus acetoxydans]|uniref:Membrane-bound metallopeptidase n=1 Tax=Acididesulfobacillus acetoxydans TaxID=1561005 RepID=A0A8S0X2R3_9FIRM|nr:peptidoglycan DD-metalloendopeptidase family protein [Acididesulfobacillus acetoxydans]CAA7599430.1 Peptidase family M23 [Acididesulfobacillus acetoxydans]CEJ06765.1 Membrane-bound metallopeptidase [Acididesulfobacillus acetoxydans]